MTTPHGGAGEWRPRAADMTPPDRPIGCQGEDVAGEHVDEVQAVGPYRPFAVEGDRLAKGIDHIQPPSTTHIWAVQERLSSAASQRTMRATSAG